jgi:hypothetical protein
MFSLLNICTKEAIVAIVVAGIAHTKKTMLKSPLNRNHRKKKDVKVR